MDNHLLIFFVETVKFLSFSINKPLHFSFSSEKICTFEEKKYILKLFEEKLPNLVPCTESEEMGTQTINKMHF